MAQYEPIGLKSGYATVLGTDTLRADLSAVAGMTTAAVASGDACQVSAALTVIPAVNTSATPIVGIYDGVSGSVVRRGVVVASFVGGLTLAAGDAVYLSAVAGRLTNVKPTNDHLHEVGVVVSAAARTIMLQQKPVVVLPATLMFMDARAPTWLLQGDTPPTYPGEQQPFPSTAAALLTALGNPVGFSDANVLAIYQCDTATPLVDSLGLGPNLVAAGGPLTQRECVGLPDTSFVSKVGCEFTDDMPASFQVPVGSEAFVDVPDGTTISTLIVLRMIAKIPAPAYVLCKRNNVGVGWFLYWTSPTFQVTTFGSLSTTQSSVVVPIDSHWSCFATVVDGVAKVSQIFTDSGDSALSAAYTGSLTNLGRFALGQSFFANAVGCQVAYLACFDRALTSAMRATFWRAFQSSAFGTPNTYTRANPIVVPIGASRVAAYAANQPCIGYNANAIAADNALGVGVVAEDGYNFVRGLDAANMESWRDSSTTHTSVDGPSGMLDSIQVNMLANFNPVSGGNFVYGWSPSIGGATNVPFSWGFYSSRGTVGVTGRGAIFLSGDAGGSESFTVYTDAAVPVAWTRQSGNVTPTRPAHNAINFLIGAALNGENCRFAQPYMIQNCAVTPLAWRLVDRTSPATSPTSTPTMSYTNLLNARYSPAKGRLRVRVAGFQNPASGGEILVLCGGGGAPGGLMFDRSGGNVRLRMWDDLGVWAVNVLSTPIAIATAYDFIVTWNAALGTASIMNGTTLMGSASPGTWTPEPTDVTPITIGSGVGGSATRATISRVTFEDY